MLHAAVTFLFFPVILYEYVWGIADIVQNFFSNFLKPPYSLGHSVYLYSYLFFAHSVIIWDVPNSVRRFFFFLMFSVFLTRFRAARQRRWTCDPPSTSLGRPVSLGPVLYKVVSLCCALFLYLKGIRCAGRSGSLQPGWRSREPDLLRLSSLSLLQSICNHFMSWNSIFLNVDDYVWGHGSLFNTWRNSKYRGTMYHTVARFGLFLFV